MSGHAIFPLPSVPCVECGILTEESQMITDEEGELICGMCVEDGAGPAVVLFHEIITVSILDSDRYPTVSKTTVPHVEGFDPAKPDSMPGAMIDSIAGLFDYGDTVHQIISQGVISERWIAGNKDWL